MAIRKTFANVARAGAAAVSIKGILCQTQPKAVSQFELKIFGFFCTFWTKYYSVFLNYIRGQGHHCRCHLWFVYLYRERTHSSSFISRWFHHSRWIHSGETTLFKYLRTVTTHHTKYAEPTERRSTEKPYGINQKYNKFEPILSATIFISLFCYITASRVEAVCVCVFRFRIFMTTFAKQTAHKFTNIEHVSKCPCDVVVLVVAVFCGGYFPLFDRNPRLKLPLQLRSYAEFCYRCMPYMQHTNHIQDVLFFISALVAPVMFRRSGSLPYF